MNLAKKIIEMNFKEGKYQDIYTGKTHMKTKNKLTREDKLILYYIYKEQKVIMGDIVSVFSLPNSTANYIINKLQNKSFVVVKKSRDDSRVREVDITEEGIIETEKMLNFLNNSIKKIYELIYNDIIEKGKLEFQPNDIEVIKKVNNLVLKMLDNK